MRKILLIVVFIGTIVSAKAQYDYMFTQYMWNEIYQNPAYAGSREAMSIVGLDRNQWVGIDGAPKTQTFSVHGPLFENKVGVGLNYMHEEIGVSKMNYLTATFAYRIKFKTGKFSFGLSSGIVNQKEFLSDVTTTSSGDQIFQTNSPRLTMPNAAFGIYYYTENFYTGFSVPRLIHNEVNTNGNFSVKNSFESKYLHFYYAVGYYKDLRNGIGIKPTLLVKMVTGAPVELDLSFNALFRETIWVGLGWRTGDAISLLTSVNLTPYFRLGYAYDHTTTQLQKFNSGTHEICIGYDFSLNKKKIVSPRHF